MKTDIQLKLVDNKYYDISFTNGDFTLTNGLDTALLMSVYGEKRANSSEVPVQYLQRGWWGNLFNDVENYEVGSKLWLLYQARRNQDTLNRGITYLNDGFKWLLQDTFIDRVEVTGEITNNGITFLVSLYRSQNLVASYSYELWQNTRLTNAN